MWRMHKGHGILTALNRTKGMPGNDVCCDSVGGDSIGGDGVDGGGSWQRKPFSVIQR